jgi:DNA-binding IscR family transcriptional regulator
MKLSEGVEQAIHCTAFLAGLSQDGVLSAAALAELHGVSTSYLLKHLQALSKAPKDISFLDIVLAVEGPAPAFRCAEIRQRGPNPLPQRYFTKPCQINAAMLKAEKAYRAELAKVSVADLLADLGADDDGGIAARGCAFLELHERKTGNRASS